MGDDRVKIRFTITPTWNFIKDVQIQVEEFLKSKKKNSDIIEATIMCATELIENAVKYGTEKPDGSSIDFDLSATEETVCITVKNGYHDVRDFQNVAENIDKINASDDHAALYVERLQELLDNPKPGVSQLGLYRIAYEGEFKLDYAHKDGILAIIAERKI
jgi:hypothetical protein